MSEQLQQPISISIDFKKYRIRIHRGTLGLLGIPKYIQFLVSPQERMIAVQGVDERTKYAHRVDLNSLQPDNSYEIYSCLFVEKLRGLDPGMQLGETYRLTGNYYEKENAVVFPLSSFQRVDSWEVG